MTKDTNTPSTDKQNSQAPAPQLSDQQHDVALALFDNIHGHGCYANRLNDMSLGYAAATGIDQREAKTALNQVFEQRFGKALPDYLSNYRQERGLKTDRGRDM